MLGIALAKLNGGNERANREIGLLQEYRTRLIADVVTGKLDVRAAAAALPEAPEIGEPATQRRPIRTLPAWRTPRRKTEEAA